MFAWKLRSLARIIIHLEMRQIFGNHKQHAINGRIVPSAPVAMTFFVHCVSACATKPPFVTNGGHR